MVFIHDLCLYARHFVFIVLGLACLLFLASDSEASKRPVVGVANIQVSAQNISCESYQKSDCNRDLSEGFRVMLETAVVKTGKMDVMERGQLDAVLAEQGLGQVGMTTSGGEMGGLKGVDYLVYGTITKFGASQSGTSVNTSGFGSKTKKVLGKGVSTSKVSTEMAVDLKVTDVKSGRIVIADTVGASVTSGEAFSIGGVQSAKGSADPFADVQRIVAARISEAIITSRTPIKVIKVQKDGTLILNYGNVFFKPGDELAVFEVGESFVDPDTGETLGAEETELGLVEITRSESKFSRAKILGKEKFKVEAGSTLKRVVSENKRKKRKRSGSRW